MRSLMTKFLVAVDDLICVYLRDFNFQSYKLDKNTFIRQLSFHFNVGPGQRITVELEFSMNFACKEMELIKIIQISFKI